MKARKRSATDSPRRYMEDESAVDEIVESEESREESESENEHQLKRTSSSSQSEMGIIEEIYCENFMCHRKMCVRLVKYIYMINVA